MKLFSLKQYLFQIFAVFVFSSSLGAVSECPAAVRRLAQMGIDLADLRLLLDSDYSQDTQVFDRAVEWTSTSDGKAFFAELQRSTERLIDSHGFSKIAPLDAIGSKRRVFEQAERVCSQPLDPSIRSIIWEWLEGSLYPRVGVSPTRREVIQRIHTFVRTGLSPRAKKALFLYLTNKGYLTVRGSSKNLDHLIRIAFDETQVAQSLIQKVVFLLDLIVAHVLPLNSYSAHSIEKLGLLKFMRTALGESESSSNYRSESDIRKELKNWDWAISWRVLRGIEPEVKELLYSGVAKALAGTRYQVPKATELKKSFISFVAHQINQMLLQRALEMGREVVSETAPQAVDNVESKEQLAPPPQPEMGVEFLPSLPLPQEPSFESEVPVEVTQQEVETPVSFVRQLAPAELIENISPNDLTDAQRPYVIRLGAKPKKLKAPSKEIQSSTIAELTWNMAKELIQRRTPSRTHYIRVMAALTELQKDYSESRFERELQSICGYLQVLEAQDRFKPAELGRHLKKLIQPHLWEIKPQGRSQARLILASTKEGLVVLDLLLDTKNNERSLRRRLDDLSDEAHAIREHSAK